MDDSASMAGPLAGLRVLELSDEKAQFCGKLMADLGADVVKIEPPEGQNTRSVGPFLNDVRAGALSIWSLPARPCGRMGWLRLRRSAKSRRGW